MDPAELRKVLNSFQTSGKSFGRIAALLGVAGFIGIAAYNSFYQVAGGHRAIVFNRFFGIKPTIYSEGMNFIVPFIEWPIIYSIRVKAHNLPSIASSKDLQQVNVTLRVLAKPNQNALPDLYRTLGTDFDERVLPSIANEVLKSVVAQFTAAQLVTQRERVSRLVKDRLIERARDFYIELEDVSLTHLTFSKEYTSAVESKQVAQQEAERARFIVERAHQTKLEIIIKAEGDAQAAIRFNQQLRSDPYGSFLTLRRIEAAKEIARVLANGNNRIYLDSSTLLLNPMGQTADPTKIVDQMLSSKPN